MDTFTVLDRAAADVAAALAGFNTEDWVVQVRLLRNEDDTVLERSARLIPTTEPC